MTFERYAEEIREAVECGHVILITGTCTVAYDGRVTSFLDTGERMVFVKQDRSIVVHKPNGVMPVNYMKEKSEITVSHTDERLVMSVSSIKKKESMHVEFTRIAHLHRQSMTDGRTIEVFGTERDMSDMIMDNPTLIDPGFVPLSREEHTALGFIDVLGHDRKGNLVVVECKKLQAEYNAVMQLKRYIDRLAEAKGTDASSIRGVLAAPTISPSAERYARSLGYEFRKVNPPERNITDRGQSGLDRWA
ncbi:MAG: endonuclease NucS [Candidatus Woesearchaeota archaeon]